MTNTEPNTVESLLAAARHQLDLAATATDKALVAHRTRIGRQFTRLAELYADRPDATDDVTIAVELLRLATSQDPPGPGDNRPDWAAVAFARANIIAAMPRLRQQIRLQVPDMAAAFGAMIPTAPGGRPVAEWLAVLAIMALFGAIVRGFQRGAQTTGHLYRKRRPD